MCVCVPNYYLIGLALHAEQEVCGLIVINVMWNIFFGTLSKVECNNGHESMHDLKLLPKIDWKNGRLLIITLFDRGSSCPVLAI